MIKRIITNLAIVLGITGLFIGAILLSNYVYHGTFLF